MPYSSAGRFVIGAAVCGLQPGSYRVVVGNHRTGGNNGWEEAVEKGPNETGYLEIQAPAHWRATDTITVTFYPAKSRWDAAPLAQVTLPGQDTKHISSYGFEAKRDESTLKASVFLQAIRRAP